MTEESQRNYSMLRTALLEKIGSETKLQVKFHQISDALSSKEPFLNINDLERYLALSLAAYVQARSQEPVCAVIESLIQIEIEAAKLIESCWRDENKYQRIKGTLAGLFSFLYFDLDKTLQEET